MTQHIRLALVGIDHPHGAHWRQLLGNVAEQVEIVSIVPGFSGGVASLEERFAHLPRFESVAALLAGPQFDAALVTLTNREGPAAIAELVTAGKHILAEKPVAASAAEAKAMVEAVETSGVAFQTGYMWRYDEGAERLRAMVGRGAFGKLISVEMNFVTSDIARRGPEHYVFDAAASGGGFFSWLACHQLDLLGYITQQAVVGVTARTGVFGATETAMEDGGAAILDLEGGGIATFVGGYWLPRWSGENHITLRGSERWVHWDPTRPGTGGVLEIHGPKPQWHAMEESFAIAADTTPGYGGRRGLALVNDWLDCIRTGRRDIRNSARSTLAVLQLIDTIYESSREGRRIACKIGP